jgi:drug/metabolite transporter superfamily protein YnfA
MSNWFLRLAALYLVIGVALGLYMAASQDHSMHPVHAHLNLLGWVSLSLFGLFYRAIPSAAGSKLAKAHFWIYVPAHAVQMVLLAILYRGRTEIEPALGAVSMLVGVGVICFAIVVWQNTKAQN